MESTDLQFPRFGCQFELNPMLMLEKSNVLVHFGTSLAQTLGICSVGTTGESVTRGIAVVIHSTYEVSAEQKVNLFHKLKRLCDFCRVSFLARMHDSPLCVELNYVSINCLAKYPVGGLKVFRTDVAVLHLGKFFLFI